MRCVEFFRTDGSINYFYWTYCAKYSYKEGVHIKVRVLYWDMKGSGWGQEEYYPVTNWRGVRCPKRMFDEPVNLKKRKGPR